jgi:hypothetical protein
MSRKPPPRRPRTTMRDDRARVSLDRHATYIVAADLAGAARYIEHCARMTQVEGFDSRCGRPDVDQHRGAARSTVLPLPASTSHFGCGHSRTAQDPIAARAMGLLCVDRGADTSNASSVRRQPWPTSTTSLPRSCPARQRRTSTAGRGSIRAPRHLVTRRAGDILRRGRVAQRVG